MPSRPKPANDTALFHVHSWGSFHCPGGMVALGNDALLSSHVLENRLKSNASRFLICIPTIGYGPLALTISLIAVVCGRPHSATHSGTLISFAATSALAIGVRLDSDA